MRLWTSAALSPFAVEDKSEMFKAYGTSVAATRIVPERTVVTCSESEAVELSIAYS